MKNKKIKIVIIGLVSILILGAFSTTGIYNGVKDAIYANNKNKSELAVGSEDFETKKFNGGAYLIIDKPLDSAVYLEKDLIVVHVVDQNGDNVKDAYVEILEYDYIHDTTGWGGNAYLTAPSVTEDTDVRIHAETFEGEECIEDIKITIRAKKLYVSAPSSTSEGETFKVTVKSQDGKAVIGAKVTFDDTTEYTDIYGMVTFSAPFVIEDTNYNIIASAPLRWYEDGEKEIKVIDKGVVICGYVVGDDGANGWVPLNNAKISLNNEHKATTNKNGYYIFEVPPSSLQIVPTTSSLEGYFCTIIASHDGYEIDSWSGSIYGTMYINFALK